ncbi:hypothetical protein VPH35_102132 [Triticum aestivum]
MGMGSGKKHSGSFAVLWRLALGLALLLDVSTAKGLIDISNSCEPMCGQQFDPSTDSYVVCMFGCDFGFGDGVRPQAHRSTSGEESKKMKQEIDTIHLSISRCEEQCSESYDTSSSSYSECMTICSMI